MPDGGSAAVGVHLTATRGALGEQRDADDICVYFHYRQILGNVGIVQSDLIHQHSICTLLAMGVPDTTRLLRGPL
jgi:hypothetical protein